MTDTTALLQRLTDYRDALEQHRHTLQDAYNHLDRQWYAFRAVYEGEAANQFRSHWESTCRGFDDYVRVTDQVSRLLDERIAALIEADRQSL